MTYGFIPMGNRIVGTGIAQPPLEVSNFDLSRIMDTSDDWIQRRTGVARRRFVEAGTGASDLATEACRAAVADSGVDLVDIDLLVTATMTPDYFAPGIAPLVHDKLGLAPGPAFDVRHQCSGFLYALDLADAQLASGRARTALVVGAEVHAGYLRFGRNWEVLRGERDEIDADDYAASTESRGWAVLFGDGAGAMVLQADDGPGGLTNRSLHTDGSLFELIHVPGAGFVHQPWLDATQLDAGLHLPHMDGGALFKNAVRLMPAAVREVVAADGRTVDDIDLVVSHQANERITAAMRSELGVDVETAPSNIADHGNTTAATLPILFHELRAAGRVQPGDYVVFTAFGAGAHWGAIGYDVPG